ncbi:putative O-methyltransferase [Stachybotrys elegans]|uniref:O-methyltransferase n=1 Tax=Stachybotrys elegans TaxID=80388 RepID=A0A8K0SR02_9HYPO|nr:putative O-methyltransferase [Stachybotrys elegans]
MASSSSRIAELATAVATHTQLINIYLAEKGLPQPSFDGNGTVDFNLPPELEQSRLAAIEATQELNDLLQGPRDLIFNHDQNQILYLKFISHFNIAKEVPLDGEISFRDLASKVGVDSSALTRILRLGMTRRIFNELRPGVISHSAASKLIAADSRVADWVTCSANEMWPAAQHTTDALVKWPSASEPNQTGFSLANNTSDSFYVELEKEPERARRFGGAMSFFTTGPGYSLQHLSKGYPWSSLGAATVVDIGGSHGDVAFELARSFPDLRLIVQDLPKVIAGANQQSGLNVEFMEHDFFSEQPAKGADVYIFRWILHNWPDSYCMRILKALVGALKAGSKVIVMDLVLPPAGSLPNYLDRKLRTLDVTMLAIANSHERDLDEWKDLFTQADQRFGFKSFTHPPGSNLSILEFAWDA